MKHSLYFAFTLVVIAMIALIFSMPTSKYVNAQMEMTPLFQPTEIISDSQSNESTVAGDECTTTAIESQLEIIVDEFADDPDGLLSVLFNFAAFYKALCDDLVFTSDDYGLQPLIGPIEIPEGFYRLRATTDGFLIADLVTVDGECSGSGFGSTLFNMFSGVGEAQIIFTSEGCLGFIEITNTLEPWTLTFEKVD